MEQKRFVGIDLGKRTFEIKFITSNGSVTGTNGKTYFGSIEKTFHGGNQVFPFNN